MSIKRATASAGLVVLLTSACGAHGAQPEESADAERVARLERMADVQPSLLLAQVKSAYKGTTMQVKVTRSPDDGEQPPYVFVASEDAWRVDAPVSPQSDAGDGWESVQGVDGQICMDREFRSSVSAAVMSSYATIEFDPAPWTCTPTGFGLNTVATATLRREDPRWRIENLTTDDPSTYTADVEEVRGEPLLHLRTTGVTSAGPLEPERPVYDLWVDDDHRPVRMETTDLTWEISYPQGLDGRLSAPEDDERGSYGYSLGPGQAVAKACHQAPRACARDEGVRADLIWGDGRRS